MISSRIFTEHTGLAVVCPITSRVRAFPTSVVLPPGSVVEGEVLISHVRSIDTLARPVVSAGGRIPARLAVEVRAKVNAIISI